MMLRKFYGKTIQEALRDAREQMGNDVVLIESSAPEGGRPASVTVMLDKKTEPVEEKSSDKEEFRNVLYSRSAARSPKMETNTRPENTAIAEPDDDDEPAPVVRPKKTEPVAKVAPKPAPVYNDDELPEPKGLDEFLPGMSRRKTPLIEIKNVPEGSNGAVFRDPATNRDIAALHRRLEKLESMLGESLISANLDYAAHPVFQQLISTGLRATTVAQWFKTILNRGIDPFEQNEAFTFEMSKLVRDAINVAMPQAASPNMMFVGPSGSGKTTLIMKLALSEQFFKDRKILLVSVEPRHMPKKFSALEFFAKEHNIPFQRVQDGIEVSRLMPEMVHYDQVLFDTPTISLEKNTAFREYWKMRQMLASVIPLEVHYVINATLEQYYFREAYAANHPLQPDYISITHLDESTRWGQLIPFIKTMACAIRYISLGQEIPGSIAAFSPTWFAEKVLSMGER